MYTYEQLVAMYIGLGETRKAAERHARQTMQLQNPEGLMNAYAKGSQIKTRQQAKAFNNLK